MTPLEHRVKGGGRRERVPYVRQALSLVPDEIRNLDLIEQGYYLPFDAVGNPASNGGRQLARPQIELIAARVSYLHDCFY